MRLQPVTDGRSETIPRGQHQPALRPAEHPWDCPQILDASRFLARRRPASDVEIGNLADDGRFPEVALEARRFVDQRAISTIGTFRQVLDGLDEVRTRG